MLKIGKSPITDDGNDLARQTSISKFITANFTVRQCQRYVKIDWNREASAYLLSEEQKRTYPRNLCACGRSVDWHRSNGLALQLQAPHSPGKPLVMDDDEVDEGSSNYWDSERDTLQQAASDCFGEIQFALSPGQDGQNDVIIDEGTVSDDFAKFLKLEGRCEDQYVRKVAALATHFSLWDLPNPGVIISIFGKTFNCRKDFEADFIADLANMIVSANKNNIWLVSDGKNSGISQFIGKAVSKARYEWSARKVTCLGITPWASVNKREALCSNEKDVNGKWPARYVSEISTNKSITFCEYLEPNHDAFLLIDNGKELVTSEHRVNRDFPNFKLSLIEKLTEISRSSVLTPSNVDKTISAFFSGEISAEDVLQKRSNFFNRTPAVMVLIGGGINALEELMANLVEGAKTPEMQNNQAKCRPVVVIKGFGGLADLLAFAVELEEPQPSGPKMTRKQREAFAQAKLDYEQKIVTHLGFQHMLKGLILGDERTRHEGDIIIKLKQCITAGKRWMTFLDLHKKPHSQNLRTEIFNALNTTKLYSSRKTLEVCLIFNDVENARKLMEEVESLGLGQNPFEEFCNSQATSVIFEKGLADFYRLFSATFLYMVPQKVATKSLLSSIYSKLSKRISSDQRIRLAATLFAKHRHENGELEEFMRRPDSIKNFSSFLSYLVSKVSFKYQRSDSMRELVLFELLLGKFDIALELFKDGTKHFLTAVEATCFLKRLAKLADSQQLKESYSKSAKCWEGRSLELFKRCGSMDSKSWSEKWVPLHEVLLNESRGHQSFTALDLVFDNRLDDFLSYEHVKLHLVELWHANLHPKSSSVVVWLATICPLFWGLLAWLSYMVPVSSHRTDEELGFLKVSNANKGFKLRSITVGFEFMPKMYDIKKKYGFNTKRGVGLTTAVKYLYTSPISKFTTHLTSRIVFALLLSGIILSKLDKNSISAAEIISWLWSFTYFLDYIRPKNISNLALRKLAHRNSKLRNFLRSLFLLISEVLLLIAAILRLVSLQDLIYPRTLYAVVCFQSWLLVLIVAVPANKFLGPRSLLLVHLLFELGYFLTIYAVFLVAFSLPLFAMVWPDSWESSKTASSALEFFTMSADITHDRLWNLFYQVNPHEFNSDCAANSTLPNQLRCPSHNFVAVIGFIVFMITTNLFLLNSLTAFFTKSLMTDYTSSEMKWHYWFYSTIKHYQQAMIPPAPLNVIQFVYEWISYIAYSVSRHRKIGRTNEEKLNESDEINSQQRRRVAVLQRLVAKSFHLQPTESESNNELDKVELNDLKLLTRSSNYFVQSVQEMNAKLDTQAASISKHLVEFEKHQQRTNNKLLNKSFSTSSALLDCDWVPQSQNY